jgi:hypothetical protein
MKRYNLVIILLFTAIITASAQSEFMNGYIIKNDGSRTYGQVKYIAKDYSVKECIFRWFDISTEYSFTPDEIQAFGIAYGMRYKSVNLKGQNIFMECLADGDLDLLFDGKTMYLDGDMIHVTPLTDKPGESIVNGKDFKFNSYKDLLNKLLTSEGGFQLPDYISLQPGEMQKVIADYNKSKNAEVELFTRINSSGLFEEMKNMGAYKNRFGVIAGMNASRYYASKNGLTGTAFFPEMTFFEFTPVAGLFYNRQLSRSNEIMSVQAEVIVFRNNVYIYNESTDYQGISRSDINFGFTGIKIPLFVQFTFLKGKYLPFFNIGGYHVLNLGAQYTREGEIESTTHVVRPFADNSITISKSCFGAMVGAGVKIKLNPMKSVFIELRAEKGTGVFDWDRIDQGTLSFNLFAGFNFK